jgi:lipopolysaccharide export LptBFGC system permease protein LptF
MKREYKIVLIGWLTIGLFDALGSIASKQFNFNYTLLVTISFIIYCAFGFWGTKEKTIGTRALIAAAIGFFDSTIGWEISMLFKANTGNLKNDPSIGVWIITIIFVTGLAALCGLAGGGLAKIMKRPLAK